MSDDNVKGDQYFKFMKAAKIDLATVGRNPAFKIELTSQQAAEMAELFKKAIIKKGKEEMKMARPKVEVKPDPTIPVVGSTLRYLIWDRDYGAWASGPKWGHTADINVAYRWSIDEMVKNEYYGYMIGDDARLVVIPCPEWHEVLTCTVFDEEAGEYLSQLADDAGGLDWSENPDDAQDFTLADARVAVDRVRKAYLADDEDLDEESVQNIVVRVLHGPIPDEVLAFTVTKASALYKAEGVEKANEKVAAAFAKNPHHYTGSYVQEDPVDEFTDAVGQHLYNIHKLEDCTGPCPIHGDSMHHMNEWPLVWDAKKRIFTRRCEHGQDHPDPDDQNLAKDPLLGNHACCDFVCCVNLPAMAMAGAGEDDD